MTPHGILERVGQYLQKHPALQNKPLAIYPAGASLLHYPAFFIRLEEVLEGIPFAKGGTTGGPTGVVKFAVEGITQAPFGEEISSLLQSILEGCWIPLGAERGILLKLVKSTYRQEKNGQERRTTLFFEGIVR